MDYHALELYTKTTAIAIHQFDKNHHPIFSSLNMLSDNRNLFELPIYHSLLQKNQAITITYINESEVYGHFFDGQTFFIIGPILHNTLLTLKDRYHLSFYASLNEEKWQNLTKQLPIMTNEAFANHLRMIYYLITKQACPAIIFPKNDIKMLQSNQNFNATDIKLTISRLKEAIEKQDIDQIKALTNRTWHGYEGLLSFDSFHQSMYLYIKVLTYCVSVAVENGASLENAIILMDQYILKADQEKQWRPLLKYFEDFLSDLIIMIPKKNLSPEIQLCCHYIRHHLDENLNTAKLAQVSHLSRSYLCTRFKAEINQSIADYIMTIKLEKAKEDLKNSDDAIVVIAERYGFKSQSHFSQWFKQQTKKTPKAWRQSHHLNL